VSRSFKGTFLHQLRWMKSTRYSRPAGHIGSGFTFAVPYGLAGFVSAAALDQVGWGVTLLAASLVNRVVQSILVGWKLLGDRRALRYCWMYPVRDLLGFLIWLGSFVGGRFEWRGETYRFASGGKIIPQQREVVTGDVDSVEAA
jgi:ceramide glucosyltransferase